jgi:hypothetical protein
MRANYWLATLSLCVFCACGGSSGGSGSVALPADAGTTAPDDAGTVATPPDDAGPVTAADAGTVAPDAGAAPDAGPTDPGTGDAGTGGGTVIPPADGGTAGGGTPPDAGTISADCEGIVPAALGASVTARVPAAAGFTCEGATSDEAGNVAAESDNDPSGTTSSRVWQIFSAAGVATGSVDRVRGDFFPQGVGFEGSRASDGNGLVGDIDNHFVRVSPDGVVTAGPILNGDENGSATFRGWPDGLLVVEQHCDFGPPGSITIARFADDGSEIASSGSSGGGCGFLTAANGPGGVTLGLFAQVEADGTTFDTVGRWYGADGSPTTDFFVVTKGAVLATLVLRTLVDGDIALDNGGHWLGVFAANGGTTLKSLPAWLTDSHDFTIVRGERAYARIPRRGALNHLDLISTKGTVCGTVTFPGVAGLTTGADGTVVGASGSDGCTKTWWSGLLK